MDCACSCHLCIKNNILKCNNPYVSLCVYGRIYNVHSAIYIGYYISLIVDCTVDLEQYHSWESEGRDSE